MKHSSGRWFGRSISNACQSSKRPALSFVSRDVWDRVHRDLVHPGHEGRALGPGDDFDVGRGSEGGIAASTQIQLELELSAGLGVGAVEQEGQRVGTIFEHLEL